jgi:hypothetical protein
MTNRRSGFTLIELLIFSAIFALIIGAFITILLVMVGVQSSQSSSNEAQQQGQFLDQQLQYYIESARLVDMTQDVSAGTLVLRESLASSSYDPTTFTLSNGTVYLQQGVAGTLQPLTSNKVTISNLSFTRHYNINSSSSPLGTDSVSYSFTVSAVGGAASQYSQQFESSATVLAPVPEVALIQQAKVENNAPSSASLVRAFSAPNESGDMLLAVVAYQGTGTSSIADTNGNTWKQIASTTTMAPSGTVALYAALNAVAGANTTTASFSSSATYTSMFLYEYRGAITASAFDAWGAQAQGGMTTPSSPSVSPTSSVELLFGVDDNSTPISATFSPGTGYTLETSSTVGNNTQVFVEDMNQDIANPVAASWTSGVLTSSTAMIATFLRYTYTPPSLNPVIRGTGIQASFASSYTVSWPAGTQAGDLAVITYGGGYDVSSAPSGWTENETTGNSPWWGGTVLSKVLTAGDITAGSVTVSTLGGYDGVVGIVTFVGNTAGIREVDFAQNGSGASTVNVSSTSGPLTTDTAIYFSSNRAASTDTINPGVLQRQANDGSAASGALYTQTITSAGQFGITGTYSTPGSGYYQAIVVVKGL